MARMTKRTALRIGAMLAAALTITSICVCAWLLLAAAPSVDWLEQHRMRLLQQQQQQQLLQPTIHSSDSSSLPTHSSIPSSNPSSSSSSSSSSSNRLVVSISSFPGRLDKMNLTIPSLTSAQSRTPDLVLLLIPRRIARLESRSSSSAAATSINNSIIIGSSPTSTASAPHVDDNSDLPESLLQMERSLNGLLKIVRPKIDYGPSTKLLGALEIERDPETIIVTCDDDMVYHPDTLLALEAAILHRPNTAPCFICEFYPWWTRFWNGPSVRQQWEGVCTGWANAFAAVAFKVKYFDSAIFDYTNAPPGCKLHDDVWISGNLFKKGIRPFNIVPGFSSKIQHFRHPTLSINSVKNGEKGFRNPCIAFFDYFGI